jgi:hypothetical protein
MKIVFRGYWEKPQCFIARYQNCPRLLASGEKVIVFETEIFESNEIEEMELMYMEYNTKGMHGQNTHKAIN